MKSFNRAPTGFLITLVAIAYVFGDGQIVQAAEKTKILLIGKDPDHAWGSHMYMHTCGVLKKCLEKNGEIEAVVSNGWPQDESKLKGVQSIVVYTSPGAEFLLDGPAKGQIDQMMKQGVGLVTIHWASSVYQKNLDRIGDTWLGYLGGTWISNVGLSTGTSQLKQLVPNHPICRGWKDYELHDEYYLNPKITTAQPLLQVKTKGQTVHVGWSYERPNQGRSYATTLGHFYRNFQIESFRRTIVNAILWTAHLEVPENGAMVNLPEKDLALPPKLK